MAIPDFIVPGAIVEWDTWAGVAHARITSTGDHRVSYESEDGVLGALEATQHRTLERAAAHLRPSDRPFERKNPGWSASMNL